MRKHRTIALVGSPNSGKTTLFNWMTGLNFKTVNYPGATVEVAKGFSAARMRDPVFAVYDTPGVYSLFAKSSDEEATVQILTDHHGQNSIDGVLLVVDGTQLSRHLLIARQLFEMKIPFVIAITMADLLRKNRLEINLDVLKNEYQADVILFDGLLGQGLEKIGDALRSLPDRTHFENLKSWDEQTLSTQLRQLQEISKQALGESRHQKMDQIFQSTRKIDQILMHPFLGFFIFFVVMAALFSSIFWFAAPFQDLIDSGFSVAADFIIQKWPDNLISAFVADGLIRSFAAVLVFVPQIFILFLGIGLIESTGYLARASTLIDRPFSLLGLSGRSFVPLLSGFACAVPAIMATRNLSSRRDRVITSFIIPLMVCSARLPVYSLLIAFLLHDQPAWKAGLSLTLIYFLTLFIGAFAALILHKILPKNEKSFLMMELPLYRKPRFLVTLRQSLSRTKSYVKKAGPIILTLAIVIWAGTTFPNYHNTNASERFQTSYLSQIGQFTEPIFKPMGADWRVGVGLLSAFAAREVFVSTLAMMMQIEDDEDSQQAGLLKAMSEAKFSDGSPLFTTASVVSLIFFFMIALQCMSTFAIMGKELFSQKLAWVQLISFNLIAYIGAVVIYQILSN